MPKTERREILKIYGEAPDTVSVSIVTVAPDAFPGVGRLTLNVGRRYVNTRGLAGSTL